MSNQNNKIEINIADEKMKDRWKDVSGWEPKVIQSHMHLAEGFSLIAKDRDELLGMISVYWKKLPYLNSVNFEGYIDIIEVRDDYRRKGIASQLINKAIDYCKNKDLYQIRAWSSEDKVAAINMWRSVEFSLCPAITYTSGKEIKGVYAIYKL
jgi:ribosomal protein S18 acetylase RimI-like enzyme